MDIVEFVERECGVELFEWQKEYLRDLYEMSRNDTVRIVMPRQLGRRQVYVYMNQLKELISNGKTNNCE